MGFDVRVECAVCFLLKGYNECFPEGKEKQWKRSVCTHCIERCSLESDWHPNSLHHRLLFGLNNPSTNDVCSVCTKTQLLLFELIVCEGHCGHFAEKPEVEDSESDGEMPDLVDAPPTVIPATHVNPAEPVDYSDEDTAVPIIRKVQANGLTRAQSAALHLLAEEVSGQLQAAAKRIVSSV